MLTTRTTAELKEVLLNEPSHLGVPVYYVLRDETLIKSPEPNITIILPHKIGDELPKTLGHYHNHGEPETYRILYGNAGLLVQKPDPKEKSKILDVKLLKGKVGDVITVPEGYGHCLINLGSEMLITGDWESETAGHLYDDIKELHGFCYYIIEKDGKIILVKNRNYKEVPELTI